MIGNPLKVKDLISELEQRTIGLPEIQREYVWKRPQVAKLLDSIYRGFPTGSILLWDTNEPPRMREVATSLGKNVKADFVPKIVLDGQQRLTSLGRVFDKDAPQEERILFNVETETFEVYARSTKADPRWIDVTQFLTGQVNELDILEGLKEAKVLSPTDKATRDKLHGRLKRLASVREYQYPVELVKEDDLETVTEVFIRVNSGGTRLRDAELALARLAWKLPGSVTGALEAIEDACETRGFDFDARFLMRSLISVATRQSRFKDLKAFWQRDPKEIERVMRKLGDAVKLALDFVEGNVGIPGSGLLPSHFSVIPLIVVFADRTEIGAGDEHTLRRWFLAANAFSWYVGATETTLNQDLAALGDGSRNIGQLYENLLKGLRADPNVKPEDLEQKGATSPFFPLAYLAVARRSAKDWFTGLAIRRDSFSEDQDLEYHHIFPKKHLNEQKINRYTRDEMANLAFLGRKANRRILARKPDDYLAEIARQDPQRLSAQMVPDDRSLWQLDCFTEFLNARRKLLAEAMNEVLRG